MKLTYTTTHSKNIPALILLTVFVLTMLNFKKASSQVLKTQPQLNIGVDAYVSGSGLGAFYSGYVGVTKGRHMVNAGPCMQSRSMLMRGGRVCYSYMLTGYRDKSSLSGMLEQVDESVQLQFFSYAQYVNKLPLSASAMAREEKLNTNERDWKDIRLSTVEVGAGASLNVRISKRVYWKNTVAISGYYHVNYPGSMCHERGALMLTVGTGFNIPSF